MSKMFPHLEIVRVHQAAPRPTRDDVGYLYAVYWIHLPDQLDPFLTGYVGVSNNVEMSWSSFFGRLNKGSCELQWAAAYCCS